VTLSYYIRVISVTTESASGIIPSYYFHQSLKLSWLPKVITSRAFSCIKSEQKFNVSVTLLMTETDTIFETSDFRLNSNISWKCGIISANKAKMTNKIQGLQGSFFHVIQINKTKQPGGNRYCLLWPPWDIYYCDASPMVAPSV